MTVRKKVRLFDPKGGKMMAGLEIVRKVIQKLPTDDGVNMAETAKAEAAPKKSGTKKASKGEVVTLKEICKGLKVKPSAARKALRKAKVKNPGRWSWPKGSAEIKKVQDILK